MSADYRQRIAATSFPKLLSLSLLHIRTSKSPPKQLPLASFKFLATALAEALLTLRQRSYIGDKLADVLRPELLSERRHFAFALPDDFTEFRIRFLLHLV
jgi:hypothetical protein